MEIPKIIQGGMGIGVSNWRLSAAVAQTGQLGIVSGLCLDQILIRRLQLGDPSGVARRAMEHFPVKEIANRILNKFYKPKGKATNEPFMHIEMQTPEMSEEREDLIVAGGFMEIFLAKEGHDGFIGVNMLEKTQTDTMATLYGCMLAGVDCVTMGAGIPRNIPGTLDSLSQNKLTTLNLVVANATPEDDFKMTFNPARFKQTKDLIRPKFLAIISSNTLATTLSKKANGHIDGFIIETSEAGGHNAPPRGNKELSSIGEPIYGTKDDVDLEKIKALNVPFWMAGSRASHEQLLEALSLGAQGIQSATPFMLAQESGVTAPLKKAILASERKVFTDPAASPTGFPFKVIRVPGTLSDKKVYDARKRICDLGYLRERYRKDDGTIGYRCPAEPVNAYVAKGGDAQQTTNSQCLCNALFANIGLGSIHPSGDEEKPLLTGGSILSELDWITEDTTAKDIVNKLLAKD